MGKSNKLKFDYKWVIIVLAFLMEMVTLGFCSSTKSLYIAPVTSALGVKRAAFALNDTCRFVSMAIFNMLFGFLVSRFGQKKLIMTGFLSLIASQLIYSFATNVFVFYIGGMFLGIGFAFVGTPMVSCVVNRWFKESKGKIMGAILAANGVGAATAIQVVTPIIENGVFGYRNAYRLVAVILFALFVLMLLFFKDKPSDSANKEEEVPKKKSRSRDWVGIEYKEAIKMPLFYVVLICIFLTGFVLQGISGVAAAHMKDVGLDPIYVGRVLSIHSLFLTLAKFFAGHLYDRFGLRTAVNTSGIMAIVDVILLAVLTNSYTGKIFAMLYGVASSFALPLETIMLPLYAGDLFGQKSFDKLVGFFVATNAIGLAISAPIVNICYDILGSYRVGFVICAVLMSITLITLQFVIRKGRKLKEQIIQQEENRICEVQNN